MKSVNGQAENPFPPPQERANPKSAPWLLAIDSSISAVAPKNDAAPGRIDTLPQMMRFTLAWILAGSFWMTGTAWAGLSSPIPFAKLSEDESRILVIRDGGNGFSKRQVSNPRLSTGAEIDFLEVFPTSGVYALPDRNQIYEIDWFCLERELLASDDLEHLARLNRFGVPWALKFYNHGEEIRSFNLDHLLTAFSNERFRPFRTSDYHYAWHQDFELSNGQVVVKTVDRKFAGLPVRFNEVHRFNLMTGALTKTEVRNGPLRILVGSAAIVVGLTALIFVAVKGRQSQQRQNESMGATG